ncbi:MAG: HAD family hydrolase [Candidatus Saccharicenans sp.]|nr:MAG: HAD family hydrolase [Candidatus Aminicenantes bacterium]HEK86221.1 HAD family hydrolase [Candidatus Aminicenantes bacterium]
MKFKGVIFDLDGTLLDTIFDITVALNVVLARNGFRQYSIEECKKMVGDGMEVLVKRAVPEIASDEKAIKRLIQDYRLEYARIWRQNSMPYPGIPEVLSRLKQAKMKIAVLSNKSHEFTEIMTKELLPVEFDVIRGACPGIPVKPDPQPAQLVLKELNLSPAEVVYVGDTSVDMETATSAGCFAAGALWGFRDAKELIESGAQVLLEKPADLLPLVFVS